MTEQEARDGYNHLLAAAKHIQEVSSDFLGCVDTSVSQGILTLMAVWADTVNESFDISDTTRFGRERRLAKIQRLADELEGLVKHCM